MRNTNTIYDFLASDEIETAQIARFDQMYALASDAARVNVDEVINSFKQTRYMGEKGAKFLYMRLHDFFNMEPKEQETARKIGVQLLSIQPTSPNA